MSAVDPLAPQLAPSASESLDAEHDGRSSSLSDVGDHATDERGESKFGANDDAEANDTEAETERLENTPLKRRKHQNVVLTAESREYSSRTSPSQATVLNNQLQQTSDISSLEDSSEEEPNHAFTTSSPRKRKRSSFEDQSSSSRRSPTGNKSPSASSPSPSLIPKAAEAPSEKILQNENAIESEIESLHKTPRKRQNVEAGKRKVNKISITEDVRGDKVIDHAENGDAGDVGETVYSNGEDAEAEDLGDAEMDNAGKPEEGSLKKKSALDSLKALEKCFATLRDKLFDERLASANQELALLQQPGFAHPELLAMKEAVDHHRNEKIEYQRKHLKYKLQSLQRESVAMKHQALSQYMQTVREIRDKALAQLNREFYQLQRGRRSVEGDVPDYMYTFTTKRSQQIAQQTAYSNEVSVLSGVAKYVGFPAAPKIKSARPNELDEDMRNMGIGLQSPQMVHNRPPLPRASYSTAGIPQRTPAIEDFLERNAWANPQHSAHQQQRKQMHRQISDLSRAPTPSATPAGQRRAIDLRKPQGSASTVPELQSGPNSSLAPTPATGEHTELPSAQSNAMRAQKIEDSTPSKIAGSIPEATPTTAPIPEAIPQQSPISNLSKPDRNASPSITRNPPARDTHTPSALPKPLPFTQSAAARTSSPARLSVMVEDVGQPPGHSPAAHQFSGPPRAIAAGNGQRFGS